ncbi:hypothetical protein L1279_001141 [Planomicrobium sp. HSC-17F08]|nr:hypothetical protein [Planomicrobium sp. HSC-17F08]
MRRVTKIEIVGKGKIFWGVYKDGKYTSEGGITPLEARDTTGGLTSGYRKAYNTEVYLFPKGFIPKENTPYLCVEKVGKKCKRGITTYVDIHLLNPYEIKSHWEPNHRFPDAVWDKGYWKKEELFGRGFLSPDEKTIYVIAEKDWFEVGEAFKENYNL